MDDGFIDFGDVSRKQLGMQCQYASDYAGASHSS